MASSPKMLWASLKTLLEDTVNNYGQTPLHQACDNGHLEVVKFLIKEGKCKVDAVANIGWTPLHYACREGHLDVVKFLTKEGKCKVDNRGWTPLHYACFNGHLDVVKFLTKEGKCKVDVTSNNGETPLDVALNWGHTEVAEYLKSLPKVTSDPLSSQQTPSPTSDTQQPQTTDTQETLTNNLSVSAEDDGTSTSDAKEQQKNNEKLDNLMHDKDRTDVQYFNVYFTGPSGLGKTTTSRRLLKLVMNIESLPDKLTQRCSTFLAECTQVLAIVNESEGTLTFDVAEGLEEEARLIYKYLLGKGAGKTKKKIRKRSPIRGEPRKQPRKPTEDDSISKTQSVPIQSEPSLVNDQPDSAPTTTSAEEEENMIEIVTVDVDKVVECLRTIVGSGKYAEGLMGKILLNLVDIGGQPGFTEMIPFLTKGIGIFLAFFPLDKNLDDACEVSYERDGAKITPYKSTYSIREMLSQLLSSADHHTPRDVTINPKQADKVGNLSKIKPVATLIGTFKDRLEMQVKTELAVEKLSKFPTKDLTKVVKHTLENESGHSVRDESSDQPGALEANIQNAVDQLLDSHEFTKHVDKRLNEKLEKKKEDIQSLSSKFQDLLLHPEGEEFFAVDNLKGTHKDLDPLRKHLYNVFTTKFKDAKLPVLPSQLLLGVVLRKEYSIVPMIDCIKIGKALNMKEEDVRFAVWYLSQFIGALIHRPDIKDEEEWFTNNLICSPQVVFDSISALIVEPLVNLHCHGHESTFTQSERNDWRHMGQFSLETIRQCQENYSKVEAGKLIPVDKLVLLMEHSHLLAAIKTKAVQGKEKVMYFMPAILECATPGELCKPPPTDIDTPSPIKITFKHGYVPIGLFSAMISELASRGSGHSLGMTWKLVDSHVKRNRVSFYISSVDHLVTLVTHIDCIEIRVVRNPEKRKTSLYEICSGVLSTALYIMKEINPLIDPIIAFDCLCQSSEKLCRLTHDELNGTCFICEYCGEIDVTPHQITWFQQEVELDEPAYLQALPCKDKSLSFNWSKKRPRVNKEGNELEVENVKQCHCKDYFSCEVLKDKQPLFSVYHCLKIADNSSTTNSDTAFLDEVREATKSIRADWYNLAIELDINYATRRDIQTSHRFADVCWRVMLKHWVERTSPAPTWYTLVTALQSKAIGQHRIAKDIAKKMDVRDQKPEAQETLNLTAQLSVDKHLKVIRSATWELRAQWQRLGEELQVSNDTLEVIEYDYRKVELCFTAMLERWMEGEVSGTPATLATLIEALNGQVIDHVDIAETVTKLSSGI